MALALCAPRLEGNSWCGPAVLSSLLGCTSGEAAGLLRSLAGLKRVKGTLSGELKKVLVAHNINLERVKCYERPTLAAWLRSPERDGTQLYLVNAGRHWQLIQGRRYTCGRVAEVVSIRDKRVARRARVTEVFRVVPTGPRIKPKLGKPARKKADPLARRCRQLASQLGCHVDYERDIGVWWVYGPEGAYEGRDDPYEGSHNHYSWDEVWQALLEYQKDLEAKP